MLPNIPSLCCCDEAVWSGYRVSVAGLLLGWSPLTSGVVPGTALAPVLYRKIRFASHFRGYNSDGSPFDTRRSLDFEFLRYPALEPFGSQRTETFAESVNPDEEIVPGADGRFVEESPTRSQVRQNNNAVGSFIVTTITISLPVTYDEATRELAAILTGLPFVETVESFEDTPAGDLVTENWLDGASVHIISPDGIPRRVVTPDPRPPGFSRPNRGAWLLNLGLSPIELFCGFLIPGLLVPRQSITHVNGESGTFIQSPRYLSIAKYRGATYRSTIVRSDHSFFNQAPTNPTWSEDGCGRAAANPAAPDFYEMSGLDFVPGAGEIWAQGFTPEFSACWLSQAHFPVTRPAWDLAPTFEGDPDGFLDPATGLWVKRVPGTRPPETTFPPTSC